MSVDALTPEQRQVVLHPSGRHARVLATAGSGKTTTMAHRIRYLLCEEHVGTADILVLMFNRSARHDFQEKIAALGLPDSVRAQVHTFHSYCRHLIQKAQTAGLLPGGLRFLFNTDGRQARDYLRQAIRQVEATSNLPPGTIDLDGAEQAISLWKDSLIPPERAGHRESAYLPLVYAAFEDLRLAQGGMTYDDLVPTAVDLLERHPTFREQQASFAHLMIDEYQDVNFAQQKLLELLAGGGADVMSVGDDDQTIYEWRGARPRYISEGFEDRFANKPHDTYPLSRSFRFGPEIARCARNVIERNTGRAPKALLAHDFDKDGRITVVQYQPGDAVDGNRQLAHRIANMLKVSAVPPREIAVLTRTYAQSYGLQAELLAQRVPFRVVGHKPFHECREIQALLGYIRLALGLEKAVDGETEGLLLQVANVPNQMLPASELQAACARAPPAAHG